MGNIIALSFLLIPAIGIIILYNKYGGRYGNKVLFTFLLTILLYWLVDSIINDVMKLSSPCNHNANPILFQLLFFTQCSIVPDINLLPLQSTERYIYWGFFFERLLLDYIAHWVGLLVIYWGILKAVIDEGWTHKQWDKYFFWNFIIYQIIINNEFYFSLF